MAEIDVLKAQIVRQSPSVSWGLTLQGGGDQPLTIYRVVPGSPVAKIGLKSSDTVTEISDVSTEGMSCQQAMDYINQHGQTLVLTVERRAYGRVPTNPVLQEENPNRPKAYQTMDMSGAEKNPRRQRVRDTPPQHMVYQPPYESFPQQEPSYPQSSYSDPHFQIVTVAPRPPSPNQPQRRSYQTYNLNGKPEQQQQYPTNEYNFPTAVSRPFVEPESRPYLPPAPVNRQPPQAFPPLKAPPRQPGYSTPPMNSPTHLTAEEDKYDTGVSQSRTFRVLRSLMANEEPYSGVQGLPPQRSATMERMKQEWVQNQSQPGQRMKVLMPQQYNNPMSLYSAPNVVQTFAQQATGLMNEIEAKAVTDEQAMMSNVQAAVYASDQ